MMYQRLEPKAGGDNLFQEVKPQVADRTPHDTTKVSMAEHAEMNIQGGRADKGPGPIHRKGSEGRLPRLIRARHGRQWQHLLVQPRTRSRTEVGCHVPAG